MSTPAAPSAARRALDLVQLAVGAAAAAPGAALAVASLAAGALRKDKPLHAMGVVGAGTLTVTTDTGCSGVPLLDRSGSYEVTVRWSWALGRAHDESDVHGIALRVPDADGVGDVLFASTGSGLVDRHLLQLRGPGEFGTMTTLVPVRAPAGAILIRLEPVRGSAPVDGEVGLPTEWTLSWSHPGGSWVPVGALEVSWSEDDEPIRFDPVMNVLEGTEQYPLVSTLREPAYWAGRRVRAQAKGPAD